MSNPVTNPEETPGAESAVIRGQDDARSRRGVRVWIAVLIVLLVLLGILWWWLAGR